MKHEKTQPNTSIETEEKASQAGKTCAGPVLDRTV